MKNRRFFLLLLLRILCFALQFFCHDGHSDVWAEACFCTNRRMGIICILMFFCSCVFYLLLHPAFVKFRSLVLARDDGSLALLCLLVDAHFLKTEEHKNKRGTLKIKRTFKQAWCSVALSMLLHLRCWVYNCFCWKEQKGLRYCIILLCRHSWPGPGIWCSWTVKNIIFIATICAIIEIRSLVLARDDGSQALCNV